MLFCDAGEKGRTSSAEAIAMVGSGPGFSWWLSQWMRARVCWRDGGALNLSVDAGVGSEDLSFCDVTALRQSEANR